MGCPEEIASCPGLDQQRRAARLAGPYLKTEYGCYLMRVADGS